MTIGDVSVELLDMGKRVSRVPAVFVDGAME